MRHAMRHRLPLETGFLPWMIVLSLLWIGTAATAMADETRCLTQFDTGAVNWGTGKIQVTGKAAPEVGPDGVPVAMPGSARAHAIRNIIATLKQIHITADLTVGEYASTHDIILAGIEKTAQDATITRQLYTSAMDVEIKMEAPFFGGFLQLVLPEHIREIPIISDQTPESGAHPPTATSVDHLPYSGLIIDARGLNFSPILYPTIVEEQGKAVYSSMFVSREFAVQHGVATYLCEMSTALSFDRIGTHPLVFKALRRGTDKTGALVVSLTDAKTLEKTTERHKFLKECRVVIVTD